MPVADEYYDSMDSSRSYYVGQATNCATRLAQHDREQRQWARLGLSIRMPSGTHILDHMALEAHGQDDNHSHATTAHDTTRQRDAHTRTHFELCGRALCAGDAFNHDVCIVKHVLSRSGSYTLAMRYLAVAPANLDNFESSLIDQRGTYRHGFLADTDRGCNRVAGTGTAKVDVSSFDNATPLRTQITKGLYSIFTFGRTAQCAFAEHAFMQISDKAEHTDTHDEHTMQQTTLNKRQAASRLREVLDAHAP